LTSHSQWLKLTRTARTFPLPKSILLQKGVIMKKVSVFIVFALLSVFIAGSVYAGVEPSPFRSKINQLNSVVNSLDSIDMRLERKLSDDRMPIPNGLVGLLNAMSNELVVLNGKVGKVLERLGTAPDDQRVYDALMGVRSGAAGIVQRAQRKELTDKKKDIQF